GLVCSDMGIRDSDKFYGVVPKCLIIEQFTYPSENADFFKATAYLKSWNYYSGKPIEERKERYTSENPYSGMYFENAKAEFYYDEKKLKAIINIFMGPRYGRGFSYDLKLKNDNTYLENEQLIWLS
ncbi:MAG: hypothetical protein K2J11_12145, partial [Oscillospiraceae bacterium]|nr:hypothetical protein [Oscillospiraceae bacterium]